jgi:hypothetical protein
MAQWECPSGFLRAPENLDSTQQKAAYFFTTNTGVKKIAQGPQRKIQQFRSLWPLCSQGVLWTSLVLLWLKNPKHF